MFLRLEFKTRIVSTCLAITAKALNRSVEILLRKLFCIRFIKKKRPSCFPRFQQERHTVCLEFLGPWGKFRVKHAANVASACQSKWMLLMLNHARRIQRYLHMISSSWKNAGRVKIRSAFSVRNCLSYFFQTH